MGFSDYNWGGNAWGGGGKNPFRMPTQTNTTYAPGEYSTTPLGKTQLEDAGNRQSSFNYYNMGYGLDPTTGKGRFINALYPQVSTGYESALAEDPTLSFMQYYQTIYPQLASLWSQALPEQRGEQVSRFARPVRTIPRGY